MAAAVPEVDEAEAEVPSSTRLLLSLRKQRPFRLTAGADA